jgi:hypothetical protein
MKTLVNVANQKEAELLRRGLSDPTVRAFVKVMGALVDLPSNRARERVLRFVIDKFDEEARYA